MQRQDQIKKENQYIEEDEELDMKEFVKDIQDMHQRKLLATNKVHEQDQKFAGINDKLDDYNKEVKKEDELMDVIIKSPFTLLKDKILGVFKSDKNEKLDKNDKQVIENARNYNDHKEVYNEWTLIQDGQTQKVINISNYKGDGKEYI